MQQSPTIKHLGVVDEVTERTISIRITSTSACDACGARQACSMADQVDKLLRIPNTGIAVVKGETVNVVMEASAGYWSVFLAYVIPILLLVLGIALFTLLSLADVAAVLLSLALVAAYYAILFWLRKPLERKFAMRIEKL